MICQYRTCDYTADDEPTIIQVKDPTKVKQIYFCKYHQDIFEIYLSKWQQLRILRDELKIPMLHLQDVKGIKTTQTINLATGKVVDQKEVMFTEDDDDFPF